MEASPQAPPETAPSLSVVVGAHNARTTIQACLAQLERQRQGTDVELIVVDNSTDGTAALVAEHFPAIPLIKAPEKAFIPELWAVGIAASRGALVAITTAHCIPGPDWIEQVLHAHEASYPGIGGAIENDPSAGLTDWAIYFCRYSRFMRPFAESVEADLAGDNASYKRPALDRHRALWHAGFWEPEVHTALIQEGYALWRTPAVVVYHKRSFSGLGFVRNRFWHGRQFGFDRGSRIGAGRRLVHVLGAPLVPLVLLLRVAREVWTKKRHTQKFLLSLPLIGVFYLSWAVGEASGYLRAFVKAT